MRGGGWGEWWAVNDVLQESGDVTLLASWVKNLTHNCSLRVMIFLQLHN